MQGFPTPTPASIGAQPVNDLLSSLGLLTGNGILEKTGSGAAAAASIGATGRDLLAAANDAAARTALGLGSASVLDVTQGTWTPAYVMTGGGSVTVHASSTGVWRRMGKWVEMWGFINSSGVSSPVGEVRISLPFTAKSSTNPTFFYAVSIGYAGRWQTDMPNLKALIRPFSSQTTFTLTKQSTNASTLVSVAAEDLATSSSSNQLVFFGKYEMA